MEQEHIYLESFFPVKSSVQRPTLVSQFCYGTRQRLMDILTVTFCKFQDLELDHLFQFKL